MNCEDGEMLYDVFRIKTGMGLVDYCGQVEAVSLSEAEAIARLSHPYEPAVEHLEITRAESDEP
jgi:hypothetical protein